jgi:hypothetical protein
MFHAARNDGRASVSHGSDDCYPSTDTLTHRKKDQQNGSISLPTLSHDLTRIAEADSAMDADESGKAK